MFVKIARVLAVVSVSAVVLTGCTPPMPPDVKAAALEQTHTCVPGAVNVQAGDAMTDAMSGIQASMQGACPKMTFTQASAGNPADLYIGAAQPAAADCKPTTTVPFALDAAVVSATLSQAAGLILSPATIAGIFDGSITKWNDPAITADNGGVEVSTGAIKVFPYSDPQSLAALGNWYHYLTGKKFAPTLVTAKSDLSVADLGTLPEDSVALISYSLNSMYSVNAMVPPLPASVLVSSKNSSGVVPDMSGIGSAGTQYSFKKAGNNIALTLDFKAKPVAPAGSTDAVDPYDAIFPVNISICGTDTKLQHAVGLYFTRQDSQGQLTNYVALPEPIREESLNQFSIGLPEPKITAP
ncbi:MAG: hypothetical protein ACKOWK_00940, partial [Micrococcales bacterium]